MAAVRSAVRCGITDGRGFQMIPERQVEKTVARCVAGMVFYHNGGKTTRTQALLAAEVRAVAGLVSGWGVTGERILRPVRAELVARYGAEAGGRLNAEFVKAFKGSAVTGTVPTIARA
jgi:hypothetical protein